MTSGREEIVGGLRAWSNYTVTVSAVTRAGAGVASPDLTCTTREDGQSLSHFDAALQDTLLLFSETVPSFVLFHLAHNFPHHIVIGRSFMLLCTIRLHSFRKKNVYYHFFILYYSKISNFGFACVKSLCNFFIMPVLFPKFSVVHALPLVLINCSSLQRRR